MSSLNYSTIIAFITITLFNLAVSSYYQQPCEQSNRPHYQDYASNNCQKLPCYSQTHQEARQRYNGAYQRPYSGRQAYQPMQEQSRQAYWQPEPYADRSYPAYQPRRAPQPVEYIDIEDEPQAVQSPRRSQPKIPVEYIDIEEDSVPQRQAVARRQPVVYRQPESKTYSTYQVLGGEQKSYSYSVGKMINKTITRTLQPQKEETISLNFLNGEEITDTTTTSSTSMTEEITTATTEQPTTTTEESDEPGAISKWIG